MTRPDKAGALMRPVGVVEKIRQHLAALQPEALGQMMRADIHALAIRAYTPDEI